MKSFLNRRLLAMVVATVLLAAMVWGATSCGKTEPSGEGSATVTAVILPAGSTIGEGETAFTLEITHLDGTTKSFTVKTDAKTVGDALLANGLIAGEDSAYGLYIKMVDGETLDYDTHKKYWAFYIDGQLAMSGADRTDITAGTVYAFRAE